MGTAARLMSPVTAIAAATITTDVQKLRQKSQLNNLDTSAGALAITPSRTPVLPISSMTNADDKDTKITFTSMSLSLLS